MAARNPKRRKSPVTAAVCIMMLLLGLLGYEIWKRQPPLLPHQVLTVKIDEIGAASIRFTRSVPTPKGLESRITAIDARGARVYDENWRRITLLDLKPGQYIRAYVNGAMYYEPCDTYYPCFKLCVLG